MSKKLLPELSIFFPFWNEEENIRKVVKSAQDFAPKIAERYEIIIVDDGSIDNTLSIARELEKTDSHIKIVTHNPNRGYGAALKEGFSNSKYSYIVFTDGDGQFDFSEAEKFATEIQKADIVIGFRKKRRDKSLFKRLLLMNLLKVGDFILFGFHFKDIDCGFKMFRKSSIEKIGPLRSEGAMITTEILARAKIKKLKIKQVGVEHYPREYGSQTGANIPVIARAILESLMIWLDIRNRRV